MPQPATEAVPGNPIREFRPEIQGLRAVAVLAVLVYHLWPAALPGGYVGVDVFFVVSGYLITGGLFNEASARGRIALGHFYARRIRRLLPAATLVLVAAAVALAWLPSTRWSAGYSEIIASALHVQNWWLATRAVDYLAASEAPGLLIHFWSLAIEEQYYLAWPLLLVLALSLPGARQAPRRVFAGLGLLIVVVSLAYSAWLSEARPALAYFSTFTRAWELGLGGLLAVLPRAWMPRAGLRAPLAVAGLAMLLVPMFVFDARTPFPGTAALWPVLGTMAVLAVAGSERRNGVSGLLSLPALQYVGGLSYSLYLWHWPLIALHGAWTGRAPDLADGVLLIVVAGALAHASKVLVEDRFRAGAMPRRPGRLIPAAGLLAVCLVLSVGAAMAGSGLRANRLVHDGPGFARHPGAAVLAGDVEAVGSELLPAPELAEADLPASFADGCVDPAGRADGCIYGVADAPVRIALVGDGSALQWQPTLELLALHNRWRLQVFAHTRCPLDVVAADAGTECGDWNRDLDAALTRDPFQLLVVAQSSPAAHGPLSADALAARLQAFAARQLAAGRPVALVRGLPRLGETCIDPGRLHDCHRERQLALAGDDPTTRAASRVPGATLLDLTDAVCRPGQCDAVVGNVPVYRDDGLLTATYARTLAPAFAQGLQGLEGWVSTAAPVPAGLVRYGNLGVLARRASRDDPDLYRDDCHVDQDGVEPTFCLYGDPASDRRVALVGDSHAAQWLPLLQAHAGREGWALYSFTKSACTFSKATVVIEGREYRACSEWNHRVDAALRELRPALVVTSQSRGHHAHGAGDAETDQRLLAEGLLSRWRGLREAGMRVLVIADTPWMRVHVPDCLAATPERGDACDTPLAEAFGMPDPILRAMQARPDVVFADLNPHLCGALACPAMADGHVLWRDQHHLTASQARRLAPRLEAVLQQALAPEEPSSGAAAP